MRPLLLIIAIILGLFLYKTYFSNSESGEAPKTKDTSDMTAVTPKAPTGLAVDVYIAKEVNQSSVVYASGTIIPNEEVEIKSEASGRLVELNLNEGAYIQEGMVIARLNDADLRSQLKKLKYEEELAAQTATRQKKLLEINAISKEEYDMAVNKVNTLSADKEFLEVQLEKTTITAPFSGRLGLKNISIGAYVTPSLVITSLVQTNPVKIDFSVPEKYTNKITIGQDIAFTIDGDEKVAYAKIIALDPKIDENLRTLRVRAKVNNSNGQYRPGMFVRVEMPLGEESSIMIPTESILPILKGKQVYVMRNGKAEAVEVKTGLRTDTEVQVEEGLHVGDSVIVSALMSIKNDMPVSLKSIVE
jgi:membrane fusion protein, multidrug efflux system